MKRLILLGLLAWTFLATISIQAAEIKSTTLSINGKDQLLLRRYSLDRVLTYQGLLKNSSGDPVPDASYNITFRIYNTSSGGSALWTSSVTSVTTAGGYFTDQLGPVTLPFDTTYYLSVQVQSDPEMTTRQRFTISPYSASADTANYAFRADTASYALSGGGGGSRWTLAGSVLSTNDYWAIARGNAGNTLLGDSARTMVNLGSYSQTGYSSGSRIYSTVGGGIANQARGNYSTIAGGNTNITYAASGTVGGGANNARDSNSAGNGTTDDGAFVGGGAKNIINGKYSATVGGYSNSSTNWYDFIGGGLTNRILGYGGVIAGGVSDTVLADLGGVASGYSNKAGDSQADTGAFIGGGYGNEAWGIYSEICGGRENFAMGDSSSVGGGVSNSAYGPSSTVGGGYNNVAGGDLSTVSGGSFNSTNGNDAAVGGGYYNYADGIFSSISGGNDNVTHNTGGYSSIGGGYQNSDSASYCYIGGGDRNSVLGAYSFVGGGQENNVGNTFSSILGGRANIARGTHSAILGGYANHIDSSGSYSMAFGVQVHVAEGYRVDFFDGGQSGFLGINRDSDNGGISYPIQVGTNTGNGNGAYLTAGGVWTNGSSRTFKENFQPLDGSELLSKISNLSISSYNYKGTTEKHIGPMAEDFVGAFDTGVNRESDGKRDDKYLSSGDVAGVALAGVQELMKKIEKLEGENVQLRKDISELKARLK